MRAVTCESTVHERLANARRHPPLGQVGTGIPYVQIGTQCTQIAALESATSLPLVS